MLAKLVSRFLDHQNRKGKDNHELDLIRYLWQERENPENRTYAAIMKAIWNQADAKESDKEAKTFQTCLSRAKSQVAAFQREDFFCRFSARRIDIDRIKGSPVTYGIVDAKPTAHRLSADEGVWLQYFTDPAFPLIISTEPMFFASETHRVFLRVLDLNAQPLTENSVADDEAKLQEQIDQYLNKNWDLADRLFLSKVLTPKNAVRHYQPSGEVLAAIRAEWWLTRPNRMNPEHTMPCLRLRDHEVHLDEYARRNAILLGNPRTNVFIRQLQDRAHKGYPYRLTEEALVGPGLPDDALNPDISSDSIYCLVSRYCVNNVLRTVVACHNGRGIEGVVLDGLMPKAGSGLCDQLYTMLRKPVENPLDRFQAVFHVKLRPGSTSALRPELVAAVEPSK